MSKTTIPCEKCAGLGLVRYYTIMTGGAGAKNSYLSVARECPVCEGRGVIERVPPGYTPRPQNIIPREITIGGKSNAGTCFLRSR